MKFFRIIFLHIMNLTPHIAIMTLFFLSMESMSKESHSNPIQSQRSTKPRSVSEATARSKFLYFMNSSIYSHENKTSQYCENEQMSFALKDDKTTLFKYFHLPRAPHNHSLEIPCEEVFKSHSSKVSGFIRLTCTEVGMWALQSFSCGSQVQNTNSNASQALNQNQNMN